jgi:hypothetical protein
VKQMALKMGAACMTDGDAALTHRMRPLQCLSEVWPGRRQQARIHLTHSSLAGSFPPMVYPLVLGRTVSALPSVSGKLLLLLLPKLLLSGRQASANPVRGS